VVRLKPPKVPKPEPPPEGYVIFISTDNGFDIDNHRAGDYKRLTMKRKKQQCSAAKPYTHGQYSHHCDLEEGHKGPHKCWHNNRAVEWA